MGVAGSSAGPAITTVNGDAMKEGSEGRLLTRALRCTPTGWEMEADQRHVDLIVQELKLDKAHGAIAPGENQPRRKDGQHEESPDPTDATLYRGLLPEPIIWMQIDRA